VSSASAYFLEGKEERKGERGQEGRKVEGKEK
jgi:hypothetical protein